MTVPASNLIFCIDKDEPNNKGGIIFSENKYKYLMQLIFAQIAMISLAFNIVQFIIKPLGETPTVAYILVGLTFGMSGLGQLDWFQSMFIPWEGSNQTETIGLFAVMVYLFLVGVKMDLSILKRSSRKAWVIGISAFISPLILTVPLAFILDSSKNYEDTKNLPLVAVMASASSFHVVSCLLTDLKILNTELGRLSTTASTISGMCSWIILTISFAVVQQNSQERKEVRYAELYFVLSTFFIIIFIAIVLRKYVTWIIKHTPNGETVKDIHVVVILLMIFGTGYIGEIFGLHCLFGPMIFGLAIPNGPPIGSALTEKLEYPIMSILLPVYFLAVGTKVDLFFYGFSMAPKWTLLLLSLGSFGKLIGVIIPCLIYQFPIRDAGILGLILSTLGTFDLANYSDGFMREHITPAHFSIMVTYALVVAATISPLVYWFYNPSRNYTSNKNRSIQNAKHNVELRLLVCIYNDENVPTIINLLEASNPTRKSQLFIFLLHIMELEGRSTPLLIAHQQYGKRSSKSIPSEHIINCFKIYEKQNQGAVVVHPFTTMTHFVSAHDDVCTLAFDKKTSLIIIPFHKQWTLEGIKESSKCRNLNKKVLNKAPCSVGILIDRGRLNHIAKSAVNCWSTYIISVIFLGDADDREALYYAMRMAEHPNINLIVHRIVPVNIMLEDMNNKILDDNLVNEYRLRSASNEGNMYREVVVNDGFEMASAIRALEISFDLILVGRRQNNYSSLFSGLMEWNEYPELGFFGDMFSSSDYKGNIPVLVVQSRNTGFNDEESVSIAT